MLFSDVWKRPQLSPRDRSLITVACLVALYRVNELPFHFKRALENGVTRDELVETITHLSFLRRLACGEHRGDDCEAGIRGSRRAMNERRAIKTLLRRWPATFGHAER